MTRSSKQLFVYEKPSNIEVVELSPAPNTPSPNLQQSQSRSQALDDDTTINEGNVESPIQGSDNTVGSSSIRRGHGVTTGRSIEKAILENDKKLLEIEFPEGFKKLCRFAKHLANGVGVIVRHGAGLDFLTPWSELGEELKLTLYGGLGVNQSPVENFVITHKKNEVFVSEKAEAAYREMERLRTISTDSDSDPISSEREIIKTVLGNKFGYDKGLGYNETKAMPPTIWYRLVAGLNAQLRLVQHGRLRMLLLHVLSWLETISNPSLSKHGILVDLHGFSLHHLVITISASDLLADEDVDEKSPSCRTSTFLNIVALGNVESCIEVQAGIKFLKPEVDNQPSPRGHRSCKENSMAAGSPIRSQHIE
ncbi:hypothetical protein KSP40_PGU000446 [Platanthera guangdongensis]|uniref:Uncharacterized protein n=1 Tax=Platanthera guangdongensis TaxID=2320717 RepID=A0ABR2MHB0_9ASPA